MADRTDTAPATVAARALMAVPCCCHAAYYERGLVAPDCDHHDLADELAAWLRCNCLGCQRLAMHSRG